MNEPQAEDILRKTTYWHYPVDLPWGRMAASKAGHNDRHEWRRRHFFTRLVQLYGGSLSGKRVLDLACCQGFWSFEAARAGADHCVGLDSSPAFVREAEAIQVLTGAPGCDFRCVNLEEDRWWTVVEPVDITLFLGLFYHLTDAVSVLRRALCVTRETVVIDTEVTADDRPTLTILPRDPKEPTTCLSNPVAAIRMRPSCSAISMLLQSQQFHHIEFLDPDQEAPDEYREGRRVSVIARRAPASSAENLPETARRPGVAHAP
jgi:hypothetical protein